MEQHGRAKDGTPVIYMRIEKIDKSCASSDQYILSSCHMLEWTLSKFPGEVSVTVVMHCSALDGKASTADLNFVCGRRGRNRRAENNETLQSVSGLQVDETLRRYGCADQDDMGQSGRSEYSVFLLDSVQSVVRIVHV